MIYIHDNQPASEIMNISNRYCSGISMYMTNYNLIITTIYRPPDCTKQAFIDILDAVKNTTNDIKHLKPDIQILGDFNFPRLHWPNSKLTPGSTQSEQEQANSLLKLMDTLFLNQFILKPTRGNNILDLALSNNELLIQHYLSTPTTFSDHNFFNGHALNEINWTTVLGDNSANKAHNFLTKMEEVCKNILPIKELKVH